MADPDANSTAVINPLPKVIVVLVALIILPEAVFQLADRGYIGGPRGIGWRTDAIQKLGFFDSVWEFMLAQKTIAWGELHRFVTHIFLSYSFMDAAFGAVLTLALGKTVAERYAWWAVLAIFLAAGVLGVLALCAFVEVGYPIVGAQGAFFGLLGAFSFLQYQKAGHDRKARIFAFRIFLFLMFISLVVFVFFDAGYFWVSQLVGFLVGFVLSMVLAPDGQDRIRGWLAKLRQR